MVASAAMSGTSCPVCASTALSEFLRREAVPVHQNALVPSQAAAIAMERGSLCLKVCHRCGFIFNAAFDAHKLRYEHDYDNTQSCSACFDQYLDGNVQWMVEERGIRNRMILEIGCGKGHFLRKLVEADPGNRGWGFDPSYLGPEAALDGRLRFARRFFDDSCRVAAEVVVCRHVIEHVADPTALLRSVGKALGGSFRLFFETPCVEWILRNQVIWDFFYEHCSYFSAASLRTAFEVAGFEIVSIERTFGGQYLLCEAASSPGREPSFDAGALPAMASAFARSDEQRRQRLSAQVANLARRGAVALWGAGAKGVTLANLIDPDRRRLRCVVDINPRKQGSFIPGTGHPIVGPRALRLCGVAAVVLMNPNYREEVVSEIRASGEDIEVQLAEDGGP
jgi:hypothetical protein